MNENPKPATSRELTTISSPTRTREPTLVGVAPAAPIVMGRPPSEASHPDANAPASMRSDAHGVSSATESQVRPQVAPARERHAGAEPPPSPKHTLDAIAIGAPSAERRLGRAIAVVGACAFAIGVIVAVTAVRTKSAGATSPAQPAVPIAAANEPSSTSVQAAPAVSTSPSVANPTSKTLATPRKASPRHKHAPKRRPQR
jgi:hypothetical protein